MLLFLSWATLGFFTGLGWNLAYGDNASAVPNITVATVSAIGTGILVYLVGQSFLPDWALFRSFLPAVIGASLGFYVFQRLRST